MPGSDRRKVTGPGRLFWERVSKTPGPEGSEWPEPQVEMPTDPAAASPVSAPSCVKQEPLAPAGKAEEMSSQLSELKGSTWSRLCGWNRPTVTEGRVWSPFIPSQGAAATPMSPTAHPVLFLPNNKTPLQSSHLIHDKIVATYTAVLCIILELIKKSTKLSTF